MTAMTLLCLLLVYLLSHDIHLGSEIRHSKSISSPSLDVSDMEKLSFWAFHLMLLKVGSENFTTSVLMEFTVNIKVPRVNDFVNTY